MDKLEITTNSFVFYPIGSVVFRGPVCKSSLFLLSIVCYQRLYFVLFAVILLENLLDERL